MDDEFDHKRIFWLLPNDVHPDAVTEEIRQLETIFDEIRLYDDPNECLNDLTSFASDDNLLLIFGPSTPNLLEIFLSLPSSKFIYLTENQKYHSTSQVRGVFPTTQQLFDQLKRDLSILEKTDSHLRVSHRGDSRQRQVTTSNLSNENDEFRWSLFFFHVILDMPRPPDRLNHDLIRECRHIYRNNTKQLQLIDEFVNSYQPTDAIRWYTRDTFLYRLLNMALRTENVLIINKFRYIIQDIHHQLKSRYSPPSNILRVYRGQRISASEFEELRSSIGRSICLTSFTSTSTNVETAQIFAGNGEERPMFESVILEILIDPSEFDDDSLPFANIADLSVHEDEDEVLLSMETTMVIDSIRVEGAVTWIHLRIVRQDMSAALDLKRRIPILDIFDDDDEWTSHFILLNAVFCRKDFLQLSQLGVFLTEPASFISQNLISCVKMLRNGSLDPFDDEFDNQVVTVGYKIMSICQSMMGRQDGFSILSPLFEALYALCQCAVSINPMMILHDREKLQSALNCLREDKGLKNLLLPSLHSNRDLKSDKSGHTMRQKLPRSPSSVSDVVESLLDGDFDRLQQIALSFDILGHFQHHFNNLAKRHERRGEWSAALNCCQRIIKETQTNPNSLFILQAHIKCGDLFVKLQDFDHALESYHVALDILHQHYQPDHLLRSEVLQKIQDTNQQSQQKHKIIDLELD